jgi:hypothetical protein
MEGALPWHCTSVCAFSLFCQCVVAATPLGGHIANRIASMLDIPSMAQCCKTNSRDRRHNTFSKNACCRRSAGRPTPHAHTLHAFIILLITLTWFHNGKTHNAACLLWSNVLHFRNGHRVQRWRCALLCDFCFSRYTRRLFRQLVMRPLVSRRCVRL